MQNIWRIMDVVNHGDMWWVTSAVCLRIWAKWKQMCFLQWILQRGFSYRTNSDVLLPLAHVGAVFQGGAPALPEVPATVRVPSLQAQPADKRKMLVLAKWEVLLYIKDGAFIHYITVNGSAFLFHCMYWFDRCLIIVLKQLKQIHQMYKLLVSCLQSKLKAIFFYVPSDYAE